MVNDAQASLRPEMSPSVIVKKTGWVPGPVRTSMKKRRPLSPPGVKMLMAFCNCKTYSSKETNNLF